MTYTSINFATIGLIVKQYNRVEGSFVDLRAAHLASFGSRPVNLRAARKYTGSTSIYVLHVNPQPPLYLHIAILKSW